MTTAPARSVMPAAAISRRCRSQDAATDVSPDPDARPTCRKPRKKGDPHGPVATTHVPTKRLDEFALGVVAGLVFCPPGERREVIAGGDRGAGHFVLDVAVCRPWRCYLAPDFVHMNLRAVHGAPDLGRAGAPALGSAGWRSNHYLAVSTESSARACAMSRCMARLGSH